MARGRRKEGGGRREGRRREGEGGMREEGGGRREEGGAQRVAANPSTKQDTVVCTLLYTGTPRLCAV